MKKRTLNLILINVLLLVIITFMGCAPFHAFRVTTVPKNCTVVKSGNDATISCPDGTSVTISDGSNGSNGTNGQDGSNGTNGTNGHSLAFTQGAADVGLCSNGGTIIAMGLDLNDDLILQNSESQSVAVICNGNNGTNGTNGNDAPPSPFTPVALINPCGDAPGIYDEVFIKMQNGTILASFSDKANGQNTRFSVLTAGTYQTTDGDSCVFTLNSAGAITYENHHYN